MNSFSTIKAELESWLNREGMTAVTDKSELFINMAQRRIERDIDLRAMEKVYSFNTASLALPADYIRTKALSVTHSANQYTYLQPQSYQFIKSRQSSTGVPAFYTTVGDNIVLAPTAQQQYDMELVYYAPLATLNISQETNWLTTNVPEILLFGALLEAALFLKDDNRAQVWGSRYEEVKRSLEAQEERLDKEGGSLQVWAV